MAKAMVTGSAACSVRCVTLWGRIGTCECGVGLEMYTDVPTNHQLDLELNAMAVLWESRKEGQSVWWLQYSPS